MLSFFVSVALAAGPTAADAKRLADSGAWDELYVTWSSVKPSGYKARDAKRIGATLAEGCAALLGEDAALAWGLADKAVAFDASATALYCLGLSASRNQQPGAAEAAFRTGLAKYPKDGRFPLELGRLLLGEGDRDGALKMLARVPAKAPESVEARKLALQVRGEAAATKGRTPGAAPQVVRDVRQAPGGDERPTGPSYETTTDATGRRVRQNAYFRFIYFNKARDFGERADFEGRAQAALEEARAATKRLLTVARESPVEVVLYSREEFRLHQGERLARAVGGFYSENAIRMNDSAEMTDKTQVVLVHEYVHAVMDELLDFNHASIPRWLHEGLASYIEWRYQGSERPELPYAKALGQRARAHRLPSLATMATETLINSAEPGMAYALSGCAARGMVQRLGMDGMVSFLREAGQADSFAKLFEARMGKTLEAFDRDVESDLLQY